MQIISKDLTHIFDRKSSTEYKALDEVNVQIDQGEFVAIIGRTGSGKTTFIEHLNGLNLPTSGQILLSIDPIMIKNKEISQFVFKNTTRKIKNIKEIRRRIGVVFQFAEYQLFEETIEKDIIFGPLNMGIGFSQAKKRALEYIDVVLKDYEELFNAGEIHNHIRNFIKGDDEVIEKEISKVINFVGIETSKESKVFKKITSAFIKVANILDKKLSLNENISFIEFKNMFMDSCSKYIIDVFMHFQKDIVRARAAEYIQLVGLPKDYLTRSPFALSGGQKRRVALAGILAMEPDVLIFDEPTAGLDPEGSKEMYKIFRHLNEMGKTIIIVTHDLDHVLENTKRTLLFFDGKLIKDEATIDLMYDFDLLTNNKLQPPKLVSLVKKIESNGKKIGKVSSIEQFVERLKV